MFSKYKLKTINILPILLFFYLACLYAIYTFGIDHIYRSYREKHYQEITKSIRTEHLRRILKCADRPLKRTTVQYGNYIVLKNLFIGSVSRNVKCAETLTLTTMSDITFLKYLPTLAKRWMAPISLSIFAPASDFFIALDSIQYLRNCLPESVLVQNYISFHVYFPERHFPDYIPLTEEEALQWNYSCEPEMPPYIQVAPYYMYKVENGIHFPINVGRNVARMGANTHFILSSDVELYPSIGLAEQFLDMVARDQSVLCDIGKPCVYPLARFEVRENAPIPETKSQLVEMLATKEAIKFHWHACKLCHYMPKFNKWIKKSYQPKLSIFTTAKREGPFKRWEPIYISDNTEPMHDTRIMWEDTRDNVIQAFVLCLAGYEFRILHPAFLVHSPGIKSHKSLDPLRKQHEYGWLLRKKKLPVILPQLRLLYGNNTRCVV